VKLDTTKGPVVLEVVRAWAPKGADRFYNLVKAGFYSDVAFFRVINGFMAQFGIHEIRRYPPNGETPESPTIRCANPT